MTQRITERETGCWSDGELGHNRARMVLANVLASLYRFTDRWSDVSKVAYELDQEPSDDYAEEHEALELINELCDVGVCVDFMDGDLVCLCQGELE